jgi:hypothetical protein
MKDFIVIFNYASDHFPAQLIKGRCSPRGYPLSAQDKRLALIQFTAQMHNDDLLHFVVDVQVIPRNEAPTQLRGYRPDYITQVMANNNVRPKEKACTSTAN